MASKTLLTPEEYLRMSFDGPEPDYVEGELIRRHAGSRSHFETAERLLDSFRSLKQGHSLFGYSEVTVRTALRRYRVIDVAVFHGRPQEEYATEPVAFAIEVVSKDDRLVDINEKLAEYRRWGVPHVWLADPWARKLYTFDGSLRVVEALEAPEFGVRISAADAFES
jgi:Uma2 family endonuclease